jgi:hypothetical protein
MRRHRIPRVWKPTKAIERVRPTVDYKEEIEMMLVEGGTDGVKQSVFTASLMNYCTSDEITEYLELLLVQDKVQKFNVTQKRGRPATIWRATTLIMED